MDEIKSTTYERTSPDGSKRVNWLGLKPERLVKWQKEDASGRVVLLVPRKSRRLLLRIAAAGLKKTHFQVRLDEYGSFVWLAATGNHTVKEIAELLLEEFGSSVEPLFDRLQGYLYNLEHNKLIRYSKA